jgi:hypothetical protein
VNNENLLRFIMDSTHISGREYARRQSVINTSDVENSQVDLGK